MLHVDLNADVGESYGAYMIGDDEALFTSLTSASVAAGFHAGDPRVLRRTIRLARRHGVSIGAHPGFPDLAGFGRREMHLPPQKLQQCIVEQVELLAEAAAAAGSRLVHVKPHGALYNMAGRDEELAETIAKAIHSVDPGLMLFGLAGSALMRIARRVGVRFVSEVFADRAYRPDGSLVPRDQPGSVLHDGPSVAARAVDRAVQRGRATAGAFGLLHSDDTHVV